MEHSTLKSSVAMRRSESMQDMGSVRGSKSVNRPKNQSSSLLSEEENRLLFQLLGMEVYVRIFKKHKN